MGCVRWEWGLSCLSGLSASSLRFVMRGWAAGELRAAAIACLGHWEQLCLWSGL